jgi:hypothetical protein
LQNLIQFGVLKPGRRAGVYVFSTKDLYAAKVAQFLKKALGTNTELLSEFTSALVDRLGTLPSENMAVIVFKSRPSTERISVEVKVPFRELAQQVDERLQVVDLYKDLPRGRKRPGWRREFMATVREAAQDLGDVDTDEVLKAVRQYRNEKKEKPEVTLEAEPEATRA